MRILLLNQFFWPDSAATSQLLTDVARELSRRGHDVHAICADGGYAAPDSTSSPDVTIHRVKAVRFARGPIGRMASYVSFYVGCFWRALTVARPDIIVVLTTPPLLSLVGTATKLLRGSRYFIWEMDLYPDVAVDLKYLPKGGVVERAIGFFADYARRRSDGVLALGTCMRNRLKSRGVAAEKVMVAENWADSRQIEPASWPPSHGPLTLLYSGNFGLAHDVRTIRDAMTALRDDRRFRFIFAGGGARRQPLEVYCREQKISNAEFRSYSSKSTLGASLGSGDVGLITQQNECLGSVVPSKVYGLLAAGRPVLFIGPRESTVSQIVNKYQCGWQIDCGDHQALQALLAELAADREQVRVAGERARQALLNFHDLQHGVSRICECIGAAPLFAAGRAGEDSLADDPTPVGTF